MLCDVSNLAPPLVYSGYSPEMGHHDSVYMYSLGYVLIPKWEGWTNKLQQEVGDKGNNGRDESRNR